MDQSYLFLINDVKVQIIGCLILNNVDELDVVK